MSTPSAKSNVLEDDDDDQDYIPVGVLQVSSFRQQPAILEQIQARKPQNDDLDAQASLHDLKHQQNQSLLIPQTNLNYPQFGQLGLEEFEQGQSSFRKNDVVEEDCAPTYQHAVLKNPHFQTPEKEDVLKRSKREHEEKQDHLPQYKLLLQLMQQQQRAQAPGINSDQGNQNPVKVQARIRTASLVQNNSASENQTQLQKLSREDLNSNVPLESQNQLLKILTLAQRDQQAGQKYVQNSAADSRINSNDEGPSNISQGSVKHNIPRHIERDSPVASKSALRIEISPNYQHIPRSSTEYLPQQSPTSSTAGFHPYHPNVNNQHPEITKRLNSPVSPGRQSTSPRQTVSPRHAGGSPRQVSSSPCQFISPKQPVSPRGTTIVSSRKSQPSSPQSFHHSPSSKAQSGFSWQPSSPSSSSQIVPARRISATSSSQQDLPNSVSQFQNPLNSLNTLTYEATVENIHQHPSKFQPITTSAARRRTLSGGIVHHRATTEPSSQCQFSFSPSLTPNGPFPRDSALSLSQHSAISRNKPLTPQNTVSSSVSNAEQIRSLIKDTLSVSMANDQCSSATLTTVPSSQDSVIQDRNSSDVADSTTHFNANQKMLSKLDLPVSNGPNNLVSSAVEETVPVEITKASCEESGKNKTEISECEGVFKNFEAASHEKDVGLQLVGQTERSSFKKVNESNECTDVIPKVKKVDKKQTTSKDKDTVVKNSSVSLNRELEKLDNSDNANIRETSSKRLRKPKVPFEDSSLTADKVKKNERTNDKHSRGKHWSKNEKHRKEQKVIKSSSTLKQSVLTRSSLRRKGSKLQLMKRSDSLESRGQLMKRTLRGSDLKMKSNRYLISRKMNNIGKEAIQKQKVENSGRRETENVVKNGNKNLRDAKQELKKGNELSVSQVKGKNGKDNKDHREPKKGSESTLDQKKDSNGKDGRNEQKRKSESDKEQRRGSDAAGKRPDKDQRLNSSKDSSSTVDNEVNTRSSTRLTKQLGNPEDRSKNRNSSNSRSRNRTHEPPEDPKSQNERVTTRGSRVQESSISNERVATRASKSNEPVKDSKSTSKTVIKDSKTEELSVEQNNSTPNSRVSTRGSKAQEGPSPESNLTTKEKVATKSLRSLDVLQESNSTSDERIATRGSKAMEVSAISDSTPIERISTRSSKTPTSTTSEKTVTRGMTTRRSDGTKSASKRPIDSSDSSLPSRLSRKRTRSEEVHPSMGKEVSHNSESRPQRSKPGSQKVKHDFKNSDEDEEYNAEEEDEGSSDDRISPTTTRSGRVTSAPKRKISMCLRREASKRKYNIDEQSISDESSDSDDDSESESEKDSDSETDVEMQKDGRERKYPSRKGDKRIDALLDPKYTSDVKKDTSSYPTDVSKMMGFKLVPLTPEEMSKMPGKDSMLPFDGFMLPGTNCILFPAHFTQHVKVENQVMSTCSTLSSTQSISQPTRVLATPRPISSITESSSVKTSSPRDPLPPSTFSSLGSHHHTGLRNQSVVPSAPTPPPAVSLSSSSSSTRLSSSVASTNPWNSPSLPTPPPSVSSSSSHSSSSWNPVANLQPWMSDGSAPGSTAWNESSGSNNEGWRGNNSNNSQNNAYLPRGPYGNNSLPLNTEIVPMHDSTSQRLHDLSGSGQDPLYISDRVSASSPPVEGGLFRDSSNLSPSGYNNIALPGLGQQDISYLESKLQQEMDMSSMLLSEVPYEDEMQEPVSTMHHGGIPVCSVNLDDAEVSGRLGSVTPTLHLPSGSRGLENVNDMRPSQQQQQLQQQQQQPQQQPQHSQQQPQHQPQQQVQHHQQQQQQPQQRKQQTGFLEELMTEPRVETASTTPNVMGGNMEEASPIVVGNNTGEKTPVNTKRHLYEIIIKDEKKFGKCKICNGSFSLTSIYRHLKKHEDPTAGISCTLCGKKYSQRHNLVSHMKKIHNNGVDSRGDAREEERKKEVLEPIPKPEHSDSLESPPVEKFTVPQSATESESQIDSKEGSETKDGKKKPRKWSMDRKFTKDGLMYELMPDSPVPVSVKSKRKTQRQVERVRRFKAKKKYEAGKNIHGITYDLSKLEADTSSASEDDGESEKAQEGFEEKETSQKDSIKFNVGSNFDTNTNLEKNVGEGGKLKEENEDSKELENNGNVKVSEVVSAAFSDSKVSSSAPSGGKLNVPSSSTIKMDQQERTEARSSDISKDDDDTVEMKEPSAETNLSGTMTESESSVVDEEGISEEVSHANDSDNKAESEVTETTASNPTKEKYPCTLCTSVLASKCSFFLHMKRHRSVKDKVCNYCGKGFITGQELRSHERTHTGERPYTCDICKYTFAHQGSYQAHKKGHVKRGETEPFPPEKCYNGGGKGQQPQRRKKRAQSDGAGLQTKQKQDNSSVSVTEKSDGSPMSVQDNDNTGSESANSSKGDVSGGNMSGSDSTMRRRSLESSGLNQQHASGGMRSPGWPVANSGSGAPWEGRSSSSEQQPQQTMPHGVISNVPQQRTPAANFRDQSSPSFYSPSPTHYGPSPGAENQMMSPNVSSHPANQITSPGNYLPQQTPHNNHPHHLPSQQRFPAPHSPHMAHNMNAMKSPTHEPNYAAGNANQSYSGTGSSSGGNYDDGRLFASPGPPPPSATLVHPRKQQQQKQQMTHPPQNYSPSQQYNMFGSTPTASSSSPNSYSQPVQQQPQQQQHHHHQHHPQQQREQSGDIVNALLSQYNIPPASPYTGNARQMQSAPMQQQSQQQHQSQQHQQRHQIAPQFHNIHHQGMSQQKQQPQQYHQYHQSPSTQQQQHHHQQHPQQPSPVSGQRNMQQPFTPPPPYNPNQPKPPPPYPASYNEFYRSPQHIDESQQQSQPAQKQQAARIGSPSMHPHHHQGLNAPSSYAQFQTSPSPQQNATALSRPVSNQPATADINNTTINNNSFSQQGVRPAIQPSSPSINPQQQPPYHHHPSPSSTPSPGYFHQGTSPSSSG